MIVLSLALLSCSSDPPSALGETRQAITNGAVDDGDPAVVALLTASGSFGCTGTLIAPALVLTAAHCLEAADPVASVSFGTNARAPTRSIAVVASRPHPEFDPATLANDVAVVVLAARAEEVVPASVASVDDGIAVGDELRTVGFGRTGPLRAGPSAGTRRSGAARLASLTDARLTVVPAPSQPCSGDSGGPIFARDSGRIVGVVSQGDVECVAGSTGTRAAALAGFLAAALEPPPAAEGGCSVAPRPAATAGDAASVAALLVLVLVLGRRRPVEHA